MQEVYSIAKAIIGVGMLAILSFLVLVWLCNNWQEIYHVSDRILYEEILDWNGKKKKIAKNVFKIFFCSILLIYVAFFIAFLIVAILYETWYYYLYTILFGLAPMLLNLILTVFQEKRERDLRIKRREKW